MTAQETSQLAQELYKELVRNAAADVWDWQTIANKAFDAAQNFVIVAQKRGFATPVAAPNAPPPPPEPISYIPPPADQMAQSQSQMNDPAFPRTFSHQTQMPGAVAAAAIS